MSNKNKKVYSCSKVKNACKYCLEQVTNKNGLQCQGACQKWAHFKCLNYTPGKISDIKAGIIKVMCPCPDCDTTQAKEFLTNPPYSCSKNKCPANIKDLNCEQDDCPEKKSTKPELCSNKTCNGAQQTHTRIAPTRPPTIPYQSKSEKMEARKRVVTRIIPINSSDSCYIPECPKHKSNFSSDDETSPKAQASMVQALQEMCGTVGKLSIQIQDLMGKIDKMA